MQIYRLYDQCWCKKFKYNRLFLHKVSISIRIFSGKLCDCNFTMDLVFILSHILIYVGYSSHSLPTWWSYGILIPIKKCVLPLTLKLRASSGILTTFSQIIIDFDTLIMLSIYSEECSPVFAPVHDKWKRDHCWWHQSMIFKKRVSILITFV